MIPRLCGGRDEMSQLVHDIVSTLTVQTLRRNNAIKQMESKKNKGKMQEMLARNGRRWQMQIRPNEEIRE